jgi:ATP-dependent protease ClpP protease subunit
VSIITGLAASAGTIMALVADKRLMTHNAYAMIHELSSGNNGKYTFLSSHMIFIDQLHNKLVEFYINTTNKTRDEIENLMKNETWFNAEEYKEIGFITEII